jgi:hypothetical protein
MTSVLTLSKSPSTDEELSEVTSFLSFFADELKLGICPEQAYIYALSKYNGDLKHLFVEGASNLFIGALPLKKVLKGIANSLNSLNSQYLLQLSCKFLEKDSVEAGRVLLSMVRTLEENSSLIKKRNHLLRAKNLKTKILSLATSLVLGYVAALTPLFAMLFLIRQQNVAELTTTSLSFNPLSFWPAIVSFFFIGIITSYQLTEFTEGESSWPMLFISALIFIIIFLLTRSLLAILIG